MDNVDRNELDRKPLTYPLCVANNRDFPNLNRAANHAYWTLMKNAV